MNKINDLFIDDEKTEVTFLPNRNAYRCKSVNGYVVHARRMKKHFQIQTVEGMMKGKPRDWLVMNRAGELYPMTHSVFSSNYEKKEE